MNRSLYLLVQRGPAALQLLAKARRAAQGDEEAVDDLKHNGWAEALDILAGEGAGRFGKAIVSHGADFLMGVGSDMRGQVIDGQYRVIPPWNAFMNRYLNQPYSSNIIMGPPGSGKDTLVTQLANRLSEEHGYKVEWVNTYANDKPDFGVSISIDTIINRMAQLGKYLKLNDEEDELDYRPKKDDGIPARMPAQRRVVVINEASMAMSSNPSDPGRRASLQCLANGRHLNYHTFYLAQWSGQLPKPTLGLSVVWVKPPAGDEPDTDRDNPLVKKIWLQAIEAFKGLRRWEWYGEPWTNPKSWAYVYCKSLNGHPGYMGLVPYTPYNPFEDEFDDVDEEMVDA